MVLLLCVILSLDSFNLSTDIANLSLCSEDTYIIVHNGLREILYKVNTSVSKQS